MWWNSEITEGKDYVNGGSGGVYVLMYSVPRQVRRHAPCHTPVPHNPSHAARPRATHAKPENQLSLCEPVREGSTLDSGHCIVARGKLTGCIALLHGGSDSFGRDECSPRPGSRAVGVIWGGSQLQLSCSGGTSDRPRGHPWAAGWALWPNIFPRDRSSFWDKEVGTPPDCRLWKRSCVEMKEGWGICVSQAYCSRSWERKEDRDKKEKTSTLLFWAGLCTSLQ